MSEPKKEEAEELFWIGFVNARRLLDKADPEDLEYWIHQGYRHAVKTLEQKKREDIDADFANDYWYEEIVDDLFSMTATAYKKLDSKEKSKLLKHARIKYKAFIDQTMKQTDHRFAVITGSEVIRMCNTLEKAHSVASEYMTKTDRTAIIIHTQSR